MQAKIASYEPRYGLNKVSLIEQTRLIVQVPFAKKNLKGMILLEKNFKGNALGLMIFRLSIIIAFCEPRYGFYGNPVHIIHVFHGLPSCFTYFFHYLILNVCIIM